MPADDYADEQVVPTPEQLGEWEGTTYGDNPLPTMDGLCPHCEHPCEIPVHNRVVRGAAPAGDDGGTRGPEPVTRQFRCNCTGRHDRPEGVIDGCGRWWIGRVAQVAGAWTVEVDADPARTRRAIALAANEAGAASRVQASAEKWTAGVTALLGLFSLAGVVTAKDALVGLAGPSKVVIAVAFLLTGGLAAASLVLAYTAAYGWPGTEDVSSDAKVEGLYRRLQAAPLGSARSLRWSVLLALATVGLLLLTVMLLWFLPREAAIVVPTTTVDLVGT